LCAAKIRLTECVSACRQSGIGTIFTMSQGHEIRATNASQAFRRGSWYFATEDLAGPQAAGAGEGWQRQ